MRKFLSLLGELVYNHRKKIIILWLSGLLISLIIIFKAENNNAENELSGLEYTEANQVTEILKKDFNLKLGTNIAIVFNRKIDTQEIEKQIINSFNGINKISELNSDKPHRTKILYLEFDTKKTFIEIYRLTPKIRELLKPWAVKNKVNAMVTGNPAFQYDGYSSGQNDSKKSEIVALIISLFILIYTFGALVSAIFPIITGITTIIYLNAVVKILGIQINTLSQIMTGLIGLALAIDYSLFIISRYREEKNKHSVIESMKTSFMFPVKAIIVSSIIMLCSISALLLPDVSTSKVVVINLFIVIIISLFNSMIILPALITYFDKWMNKPKFINNMIKHTDSYNFWKKFSSHIVNYPKTYFIISCISLLLLSYPVTKLSLIESVYALTPEKTESMQAYNELEKDNWQGELIPVTLIVKANNNNEVYSSEYISFIYDLTEYLKQNQRVSSVQSLTSWGNNLKKQDYITLLGTMYSLNPLSQNTTIPLINSNKGSNLTIVNVFSKNMIDIHNVHYLLDDIREYSKTHTKYKILTGGIIARAQDFTRELYGHVPQMLGIIFLGIYVILFFYMKSIVLPLKAAFMNFLPIISAFGILTLIFQYGFLNTFLLINNPSGVINMVPVILFCITFGLSMDYEVLILSRITESYEETGDVKSAIVEGISRSGTVITGAALILLAVFLPGIFSSSPPNKQISIGISAAILIDATIVRLMLVPSFMMLMGKWNWYKF